MNVAFLIYNRPDLTARVFETIRRARPDRLLVVADGPKSDADARFCAQTRSVVEMVDWPCEVLRNYAEVNLGCKWRVSSGLDWVFETVEDAVILEDDCLPDSTFFPYAQELLMRYRDEEQVAFIGGTNFVPEQWRWPTSYRFTIYGGIWGWATWRRAWSANDLSMKVWPDLRAGDWCERVFGQRAGPHFRRVLDDVFAGKVDTWDYQWLFTVWNRGLCSTIPRKNLISNLGFRHDGTRTRNAVSHFAEQMVAPLVFPLSQPAAVLMDRRADADYLRRSRTIEARLGIWSQLCAWRWCFSAWLVHHVRRIRLWGHAK